MLTNRKETNQTKQYMKNLIYLFLMTCFLLTTIISCEKEENQDNKIITPTSTYSKVLDGKEIVNITQTSDGGFIGIVHGEDYNIIKYDIDFNIMWNKTYGGSDKDYAESIIQTKDGGFLVAGWSKSNDGDVNQNHGGYDIWICKLNSTGELIWSKSYGGTGSEGISKENSVLETASGSFYIIGHTTSNNGNVSENNGGYDAWLVKINSSGEIEFEKTYGGTGDDFGRKIIEIDSKYTISVTVKSSNGYFSESGNWVIQLDESGGILWKTNLPGTNSGYINNTSNNEIIAVNTSASEFLLSKLDGSGNVVDSNNIGFQSNSNKQPFANKILQTEDGGFIIIGDLGAGNSQDCILFRTSSNLDLKYEKIIAGNDYDKSISFFPVGINSYIYQIVTSSKDLEGIIHSEWMCSVIIKLDEFIE
jgi:hypothetical protein